MMEIQIARTYDKGVGLYEALILAEGKQLISNREADEILQDEGMYKKYNMLFPCRTGTLVAYTAAGKPFGEYLKFGELVMDMPKKYQGAVDKALVVEHPKWAIEDLSVDVPYGGKVIIKRIKADDKDIDMVDFRQKDGWAMPDAKYGIPNGKESYRSDKSARHLWRRDGEDYIGPLARYDGDFVFPAWRDVYAGGRPGDGLGVGWVEPQAKLNTFGEPDIPYVKKR